VNNHSKRRDLSLYHSSISAIGTTQHSINVYRGSCPVSCMWVWRMYPNGNSVCSDYSNSYEQLP